MKKQLKYGLFITGWIITGILLLLVLVLLIIQTEPGKRKLAEIAEKQVSEMVNGNLHIGKIEGNFFRELAVVNLVLTHDSDTLASIGKIHARYDLLPLLRNSLVVHSITIDQPYFFLRQINDSTWNFQQIIQSEPQEEKEEEEEERQGNFHFRIDEFTLRKGLIVSDVFDTIIPQRVENLNMALSASWTDKEKQAVLTHFSLTTRQPDFQLKHVAFTLTHADPFIELRDFTIETAWNRLDGKLSYAPDQGNGQAAIKIPGLNLNEFSTFIPSLKIPVTPKISIQAQITEEVARATLFMEDQDQKLSIHASSENLTEFLSSSGEMEPDYTLTADFKDINLARWTGSDELPYTLNGSIHATGKGFQPETAQLAVSGQLNNWVVGNLQPGNLKFDLRLKTGNFSGLVEGNGKFGRFKLHPSVKDFTGVPVYNIVLTTQNLDLKGLTGIEELSSDIHLTASISGKEFLSEKMKAALQLNLLNSRFRQLVIDSLVTSAAFQNNNLVLDHLRANTQHIKLSVGGNYSLDSESDLHLAATFSGWNEFRSYLPDTNLETSGSIQAGIRGSPGAYTLQTTIDLDSVRMDAWSLMHGRLEASGSLTPRDTLLQANLTTGVIQAGSLLIDSVNTRIEGGLDSLFLAANLYLPGLFSHLETTVIPGDTFRLNLSDWQIDRNNQKWELQHSPAIFEADALNYRIDNFKLGSIQAGEEQWISMDGNISRNGEQDFNLMIQNLNLAHLLEKVLPRDSIAGVFTAQVKVSGKADSLLMDAGFSLDDASYYGIGINQVTGEIGYSGDQVSMETTIRIDSTDNIRLQAAIPFLLSADSMRVELLKNEPVAGKLTIHDISLDMLNTWGMEVPAKGMFDGDMDVAGTIGAPVADGKFALQDASFGDYRFLTAEGKVNYSNNLLAFQTQVIPQDSGRVEAMAEVPLYFSSDSLSFSIRKNDSIRGQLTIDKLTLAMLQALQIPGQFAGSIDGKIEIDGTIDTPSPQGFIELKNASFILREYGLEYRDAGVRVDMLQDRIEILHLLVQSRDGQLSGSGTMNFSPDVLTGDWDTTHLELNFNRFQPFNHRQFNMQMNGTATLGGNKDEIVYGGNIVIPRAEIYIPAILRMMGHISTPDIPEPLLVQEMNKMVGLTDITLTETAVPVIEKSGESDALDNLKGNMRLRIPRNTWIKNKDLYIEIAGDLELIKKNEYFELFGSVDVVRGQYDLLGKTFLIDEGSISFQGGEDMIPRFNIKAIYVFRNQQRVKQELSLQVTGTADAPEVQFHLDGNVVSEGDALSYILFGKSMNELTINEQDNMGRAGGGALAGKAAASILSAQITNFLGNKIAVDYLEVKSDQGFDNATVVVGKYITNDLFVSYEQRFGEVQEKDMAKYEVKLEYELFRFLFFELNNSSRESGFDIIFKFDAK
ncbi:MAG: translocation/assembly module TamB domain-containing protein [Mariniphaga sp.]|nr:translocation/assembly module TamB domain-containing protein [Mariniphaga sp.]